MIKHINKDSRNLMMIKNPYRLSENIKAIRYDLDLTPDLDKFTFKGHVNIEIDVLKDTKKIILNSKDLEIINVKIENLNPKNISFDKDKQTVSFTFDKIKKGKHNLIIKFNGILNNDMNGFYRSTYVVGEEKKIMATTQFESHFARKCFPCFDEPSMKAVFAVTFHILKKLWVVSCMPVKEEVVGKVIKDVIFEDTPIMSTYLLAFIIGELEYLEGETKDNVKVRIYTTPGNKDLGKFALDICIKILDFYNDYFGIKYPLPKLDMLAIPDFAAGAMENWGAITYRETALLIDDKISSAARKQRVATVIGHELAHQWFGNLVTMKWWNDLWLNEGFASWMEYYAVDKLFPKWDMWTQFYNDDSMRAFGLDSLRSSHPIEVEVLNPEQIKEVFDAISYSKGAAIIRMLEQYLGEDIFRLGLQDYLKTFSYGNAQTDDLWKSLSKVSNKDVKKMMDSWTKKMGYPLVNVSKQGDKILLRQERFLYLKENNKDKWVIPFAVVENGKRKYYEMGETEKKISLPTGTLNINDSRTGFFRVNYSDELFNELKEKFGKLTVLDKIGLENDLFAVIIKGDVKVSKYLDFVELYKDESDYSIWSDIASKLGTILFLFPEDKFLKKINEFSVDLTSKIFKKIGWDKKDGEGHTDVMLRAVILGVAGFSDSEEIKSEAKKRFDKFLKDGELDPDLRSLVYCLNAFNGDKKTYDILTELHNKSTLQEEKRKFLSALSSFKQEHLLKKTLEFSISENVRNQDSYIGILGVSGNIYGKEIAWEFLKENYSELRKRFEESGILQHLIQGVCGGLSSSKNLEEVKQFFKDNPTPSCKRVIDQSLEAIEIHTNFIKNNKENLEKFFN